MLRDKQMYVCDKIYMVLKKINDTADDKSSYSPIVFI